MSFARNGGILCNQSYFFRKSHFFVFKYLIKKYVFRALFGLNERKLSWDVGSATSLLLEQTSIFFNFAHSFRSPDRAPEQQRDHYNMFLTRFHFCRTSVFMKEQKQYSNVVFLIVILIFLFLGAYTWAPVSQVLYFTSLMYVSCSSRDQDEL